MLNETVVDSAANANFKCNIDAATLLTNVQSGNVVSHNKQLDIIAAGQAGVFAAVQGANSARSADLLQISPTERATSSATYESGKLAGDLAALGASLANVEEMLRSVVRITPVQGTP